MLRTVSTAVAATLFGFAGLALAQTASYPNSTDRSMSTPANRGYEQNTRGYDQDYRSTQQDGRWGAAPMGSSTAPNTTRDREYGPARANNRFASEGEARAGCRGDTVVWVNTKSNVYHFAGSHAYGNTKRGAFLCRRCRSQRVVSRRPERAAHAAEPGQEFCAAIRVEPIPVTAAESGSNLQ